MTSDHRLISEERLADARRYVDHYESSDAWRWEPYYLILDLLRDHVALEADLAAARVDSDRFERVRALAAEQADDAALWAIYPDGQQPVSEAYLQQELRRLHDAIEGPRS